MTTHKAKDLLQRMTDAIQAHDLTVIDKTADELVDSARKRAKIIARPIGGRWRRTGKHCCSPSTSTAAMT